MALTEIDDDSFDVVAKKSDKKSDCKGQTTVANWHATLARRKANRI